LPFCCKLVLIIRLLIFYFNPNLLVHFSIEILALTVNVRLCLAFIVLVLMHISSREDLFWIVLGDYNSCVQIAFHDYFRVIHVSLFLH